MYLNLNLVHEVCVYLLMSRLCACQASWHGLSLDESISHMNTARGSHHVDILLARKEVLDGGKVLNGRIACGIGELELERRACGAQQRHDVLPGTQKQVDAVARS